MLTISRLLKTVRKPVSRISTENMPNGFFLNDVLWFGDHGSEKTAVARGFIIVPGERDSLDDESQDDLIDRLRVLLATLGDEFTMQVKLVVCSDYSAELERYKKQTESITDKHKYRWQIFNRTERHARYMEAMQAGRLRREILVVYFSRIIDSQPRFSLSESALNKHFQALAQSASEAFDKIHGDTLQMLFPECIVRTMTDHDHYRHCYRFLNPGIGASVPDWVFEGYDSRFSIQDNCLFGDIVQPSTSGVSFQLDGFNHAVLVMRELPKRMGPGLISRMTNLGFQDFEITVNLYPQKISKAVKEMGKIANDIKGEIVNQAKKAQSFSTQLSMANERIDNLERGVVQPFKVFFAVRLWHKDPDTLISRASITRNAFTSMSGAICHHATNAETVRQLWFQTWPGWTCGNYRAYDLDTEDQTAAELLPWSASFTGRLEDAEALYDSLNGGLVGITTQMSLVPQHILVFGMVGAGKSLLFTDLWAQTGHLFDYKLIVEEGGSHRTSAEIAGAKPIVVTPGTTVTINYLDTFGVPLTSGHVGSAVALCLQMLRENVGTNIDQSRLSVLQSVLAKHINLLYDGAWEDWSRIHPQEANQIERDAYVIENYRKNMPGDGNSFLDAWMELRDAGFPKQEVDEDQVAKFATHYMTRGIVRNLGISYLSPWEMPTHAQLVELMSYTPIGGYEDNSEAVSIGDRLSIWKSGGPYGALFDGATSVRLDGDVTYFELGLIPDSMEELKACAHFLVLNYARQAVIKRPRAQRKLVIFEEGARIITTPGGSKVLAEFYGQMRKYGAVVVTVFQQVAALQCAEESVRAAILDNTKLFLVSAQPSPRAAQDIGRALDLTNTIIETIKRYPLPEYQRDGAKFSSFLMVAPDPRRKLIGTLRNIVSKEVAYCGTSDNKVWDDRQKAVGKYGDIVVGIITEANK